ncbi:MAG TPA: M20/M25/M40 family metallo-hydrolase [Lacipirellulaceae bacterium]|nr:M20/M25/M40 family metallo-hydrolase [Lacipirellulaceae bacterium]
MAAPIRKVLCGATIFIWIVIRCLTAVAANNAVYAAAMESITTDELYKYVAVLADDVYEGREAGSRGGHAAERYLLQQLRPYHLTPAGTDGDFVQRFRDDCRNILVLQPGDDPQLQNEVIVVGAHYDHVGYGNSHNSFGPIGKIHNGADDNASGTSVVLETIEAFARTGLKTRRSILFALWDAEERGMVGSHYWLEHPTLSLDRVKLDITLDMVGRLRNERLYVLGTRSGYGMRRLFSDPLDDSLLLDFSWDISGNSDHWSFLEHRIPIALLHTGLHSDYHRPTDDAEKINRQGLREICRYLLAVLIKVADEDQLPTFRGAVRRETEDIRHSLEQPLPTASLDNWPADQPRPQLGISWREDNAEPGSVYLVRIVGGTPAAAADLAVGDRIDELNDHPIANAAAFQTEIESLLRSAQPEFRMLVERGGHMRTITVKMASNRGNLVETHATGASTGAQGR